MLVTESTSEAFNILLPLLGAIVTDSGGLLSHSAIVAREYGIPGVVGTREATERIADGTRVRVDGTPARSRCSGERRRAAAEARGHVTVRFQGRRARRRPCGTGCRFRPGVALAGDVVDAVASRDEDAIRRVAEAVAGLRRTARGSLVGRRRGRRGRELRGPAPDVAERPRRWRSSPPRSARSGGRRTPTPRSPTASASACSRARASAS